MLVICDMVIERYILNLTTIWQIDVVTYCIVGGDLRRQPLRADDARPRQRRHPAAAFGPRARYWLALATVLLALAFCIVMLVLCTAIIGTRPIRRLASNTVWRARLWIPYLSMPVGLGLLVLQYVADSLPGDRPDAAVRHQDQQDAEEVARAQAREALGDAP